MNEFDPFSPPEFNNTHSPNIEDSNDTDDTNDFLEEKITFYDQHMQPYFQNEDLKNLCVTYYDINQSPKDAITVKERKKIALCIEIMIRLLFVENHPQTVHLHHQQYQMQIQGFLDGLSEETLSNNNAIQMMVNQYVEKIFTPKIEKIFKNYDVLSRNITKFANDNKDTFSPDNKNNKIDNF